MRCALFTHPDCLLHEAEPGHPERPARLVAILNHLIETGLESELEYLQAESRRHRRLRHDPRFRLRALAVRRDSESRHRPPRRRYQPRADDRERGGTRRRCGARCGRPRAARRDAARVLRDPPAGTSRRRRPGDGVLLLQQRRARRAGRVGATGHRARRDPRFRRAPRQRHGRHLPRTPGSARVLELPAPALPASAVRPAAAEHRQHAAARVHRRSRLSQRRSSATGCRRWRDTGPI